MNVAYWQNFYKRKNSTRQPASAGTNAAVTLKEPCSFWNPEIECAGVPRDANYFKIPSGIFLAMDAYYFVSDVISVTHAMTRFKLTLDPLATYKSSIAASWQYVKRANAPGTFNAWITDELNEPTNALTIDSAATTLQRTIGGETLNFFNLTHFRYLLTTVGSPATVDYALNNGIAKTYIVSGGTMALIAVELNRNSFLQDLKAELNDPLGSIIKCVALPVELSGMTIHANEPIFFGSYSTGVTGNVLVDRVMLFDQDLNMPPSMLGQQTYLKRSPYASATIFLPCVGVCPLDIDAVGGKTLTLRVVLDAFTGDLLYTIKDKSSGYEYATFSGNCGTELPVSGGNRSSLALAAGALTTIGGIAAASPMAAASGALSFAKGLEMHTQINGGYSSCVGPWGGTQVRITAYYKDPAHAITQNAAEEGLPVEKRDMIGNYTGYVLCRNATVDTTGSLEDKQAIEQMLNEGMFIE